MKYIYPACFYKEDNGQYSVLFPDLNTATYGNDLQDAYNMAIDCLGGYLVELIEDKEEIPAASDITAIKADEQPDGFVTLVSVDTDAYRSNKSVKKTLTIPLWLEEAAQAQNINFSKVLQEALKRQLNL